MGQKKKNWYELCQKLRHDFAVLFRRWSEALEHSSQLPYRRISLVTVIDSRKQAKMMRRQAKYRDPRDMNVMARLFGEKQCVIRTLDLMRVEYRDYFDFEEYVDESGNIIIRSVLKVRKDD